MKNNIQRDVSLESPWQRGLPSVITTRPSKVTETVYDRIVVGGGITRLTAALFLRNAGKKLCWLKRQR
jgi:hypothetical protein